MLLLHFWTQPRPLQALCFTRCPLSFFLADREKPYASNFLLRSCSVLFIQIRWQKLFSSWRGYFWHLLTSCPHSDPLPPCHKLLTLRFYLIALLGLLSISPWISWTSFLFSLDFFFIWLKYILDLIIVLWKVLFAEALMCLYVCWQGA